MASLFYKNHRYKGKGSETHHVHQCFQQSLDSIILLTILIASQKVICCFLSYIFGPQDHSFSVQANQVSYLGT